MKRETWGWTDFLMNPMVNMNAKFIYYVQYYLEDIDMSNRSNVFAFGQKRFSERFSVRQVMMMVLPLLIIVLLPKVVNTNDPEMRKVRTCCYLDVL